MNRRTLIRPVNFRNENGKKCIAGLASVYYDGTPGTEYILWEYGGERAIERVLPGAFDDCAQDDVRCLFNHDPSQILGRTASGTLSLSRTKDGLAYECDMADTRIAQDVCISIQRGDVTGSSFSFDIGEQRWLEINRDNGMKTQVREIVKVSRLWDVAPVTFPAYESTSAGIRHDGDTSEASASCKRWREEQAAIEAERRARRLRLWSAA